MFINKLAFFKGLELSTPINSSVLITVVPILVFVFSAFFLKEKMRFLRVFGVISGFVGALVLILYSPSTSFNAPNIPFGKPYVRYKFIHLWALFNFQKIG